MQGVELRIDGPELELEWYDKSATIQELAEEVERVRPAPGLITAGCAGCGICCGDTIPVFSEDIYRLAGRAGMPAKEYIAAYLELPKRVYPAERHKTIAEQTARDGLTEEESSLLYDFNIGDPISPKKGSSGQCGFLDANLCTIYADRPFICMLHICNSGDRLSSIHANIVRQGIWDSYCVPGWIRKTDIPHNPFVRYAEIREIPIAEFEYDMTGIMEKLADYF